MVSVDTCSNTEDGFIDGKIGRLAERKNCGLDLVPETVSLHKSAGNMKPTKQSKYQKDSVVTLSNSCQDVDSLSSQLPYGDVEAYVFSTCGSGLG
jgi:hypothetical protein